jgi:DNA-binding response OmpR family regulator
LFGEGDSMEAIQKNILVVDDEENIVSVIKAYLVKEGFRVFTAYNGQEALQLFENKTIHFIVLDLMLPDVSGEEICKKIRIQSQVPILMLTAKAEEMDKINGLGMGADDYMVKPFSPKELIARIKTILRRTGKEGVMADLIEFHNGDLIISLDKMDVKKRGNKVDLTATEYKLLSLMAQNEGKVFTREELVIKVLGFDYEGFDRTIDAHIKNIRHKIEKCGEKYIVTVYGTGYKFVGE